MKNIDKSIRATNYITDFTLIYIIWYLIVYFFDFYDLSFYVIMFFYYLLMEISTGQTVGKMFTKTKVVKKDGSKPSFINILLRTLWRIVPIDMLSYLFGYERGMHDIFSSTRLKRLD